MRQKLSFVHRLLLSRYGPTKHPNYDPVETLILTILSQNTNDTNRDRAYETLKREFPTWEKTLSAPQGKLRGSIRVAGLSRGKSLAIKRALSKIKKDFNTFTLAPLRNIGLDEARTYLTSIKGVGPKTAAVVLCFSFGFPAFPVDTHIYRVAKRLGAIPEKTSREKAHILLEHAIPPNQSLVYSLHINLINHGRDTCRARNPKCPECVLRKVCAYKHKTKTSRKTP